MEARSSLQNPLFVLVYIAALLLCGKLWFPADEKLGIVMFFLSMFPLFFFLLKWPNTPGALFGGFCFMLLGKLIYAWTTPPVSGPDEVHYYEQVGAFQELPSFFNYAVDHFVTQWGNISAYPMFGMLYMPLFKWLELEDPLAIIMLNSLLLILVVNQTYRIHARYFNYATPESLRGRERGEGGSQEEQRMYAIIIFGLLASPSFMLLSSVFAKDVACALLGLYGAGLLLRRRYLLFLLVMAYATGLRDYSIIYTVGIYFLYARKVKLASLVMLIAAGVLALQIGPLGLMNAVLLLLFLFISPNPIQPGNWDSQLIMRTLEALWMSVVLIISAINFAKYKETRSFYLLAFLILFAYACALVLVGYVTVTGRELEYGLGTVGDNMVRKKLPILPILYVISAYSILWGQKWIRPGVRKGEHHG